ncbi:MAG TPA: hypothetical protein VGD05_10400, partial [Pyrinomonadaceae bacterium]
MLLRKDDDTELKMNIVGYQFPQLIDDPDDGNWLNVKIQVKHPNGNWQRIDSCLETFELKFLFEWFEDISEGKKVENHLYFTEPCLEFEIKRNEEKTEIRVFLSYEFAPPWIKKYEESFFIDFIISA